MKKTMLAKAMVVAAVFFTAACSTNTPPVAPEGTTGGIFSYSPREIPTDEGELLSFALNIRGDNTPSLSEVRRMEREMVEKIPEGSERADFELALTDIKKILALCEINYFEGNFEGNMIDNLRFSYGGSVPENGMPLIRASKEREGKLFYADIIPGIRKFGCFFTKSDRARFGKYLGW